MSDDAVKKIYRSRQPVTHEGRTGFLDFWTKDESRALAETEKDSTRVFESFSYSDICKLPPGSRAKAEAAWAAAFEKLDWNRVGPRNGLTRMARFGVGVYTPNVTTSFPNTENPISESGVWVNNGTLWTKVQTSGALAFGTQDNSGGFDDSFTHLAASFPSDQWGEGTIHKGASSGTMEVEVILRANSSSSSATFYECNLAHNGTYTEIVRWEGGLGSFTYLSQPGSVGFTPADGDRFYAQIKGSLITVKVFRVSTGSYTTVNSYDTASDTKIYRSGKPGFAFYRASGAASNTYCYSNYQCGIL